MALVVIVGVPGAGKTTLANNLKPLFEATGRECVIVTEPQVEDGAWSAHHLEIAARSDFKASVHRALLPDRVTIADGMNFIKGLRYELYCFAREAGIGFCCAFCDVSTEIAIQRSKDRYPEDILNHLIGRMETPNEKQRWDRPLVIVNDANERATL
jgi:protein KTI12